MSVAAPPPTTKWASAEDWTRHKDTIIKLYAHESLTLKEVIPIMEREHDFYAT